MDQFAIDGVEVEKSEQRGEEKQAAAGVCSI